MGINKFFYIAATGLLILFVLSALVTCSNIKLVVGTIDSQWESITNLHKDRVLIIDAMCLLPSVKEGAPDFIADVTTVKDELTVVLQGINLKKYDHTTKDQVVTYFKHQGKVLTLVQNVIAINNKFKPISEDAKFVVLKDKLLLCQKNLEEEMKKFTTSVKGHNNMKGLTAMVAERRGVGSVPPVPEDK